MKTHLGLFEGIGGFSIGAEAAGLETIAWCEIDPFCQHVLKYHFPNAEPNSDIKNTDFTRYAGKVDLLTGGFPCQPYSVAGKQLGTKDDRHLWPEMLRAIREIKPKYVLGENVGGLVSWNGGLVFEQVQADLEAEGYEVQAFILPACAVDAPHRRDRVWIVAHATGGNDRRDKRELSKSHGRQNWNNISTFEKSGCGLCEKWSTANACGAGRGKFNTPEKSELSRYGSGVFATVAPDSTSSRRAQGLRNSEPGLPSQDLPDWRGFPTQSPLCGVYDGISESMVRYIKQEVYATISEKYSDKDLQEVWIEFRQEEVLRKIRRLYKIYDEGILLKVMQLCSSGNTDKKGTSLFSEKASETLLRKLRKYGAFTNSPQGRKLEKQFRGEFADTMPYLSHEIALVAMEVQRATVAFNKWHRRESIKAYGNAIVPQIAYRIIKAIIATEQ